MTLRNFIIENNVGAVSAEDLIEKKLKSVLLLIDHIENSEQYKKKDREIYQSLKGFIEDVFTKKKYEY